jgi:hypothetical protein
MNKRFFAWALAIATIGAVLGCAPDNDRDTGANGGGGGQTAMQQERQRQMNQQSQQSQRNTNNTWWDQATANMSNDLSTEGRDFAEAYTRVPWIHANLAAGDWERALDDLHFVRDQLRDLERDNDVSADIKAKFVGLRPMVASLDKKIQAHDKTAMQDTQRMLMVFANAVNDPKILAWMGDQTRGGGAGMGDTKDKGMKHNP